MVVVRSLLSKAGNNTISVYKSMVRAGTLKAKVDAIDTFTLAKM